MFMTDGVVSVLRQHQWRIALLEMPDAIVIQDISDVLHEAEGLLEIIKHRDGRDDFRFSSPELTLKSFCREEVCYDMNAGLVVIPKPRCRWIHSDARQIRGIERE